MTVVGRLSVLMSGFSVIATKMLFLGALTTSWQKLDTALSLGTLI